MGVIPFNKEDFVPIGTFDLRGKGIPVIAIKANPVWKPGVRSNYREPPQPPSTS